MPTNGNKKRTYRVGIIMLNTHFPRLKGDIGNPETFNDHGLNCETFYERVDIATVDSVISETGVSNQVASAILDAAQKLERQFVDLIVTSCGFLGELQAELDQQIKAPIISSSLVLTPLIRNIYGKDTTLGVITFNAKKLKPIHFNGYFDDRILIGGIEGGQELHSVIANDLTELDANRAEADVIQATKELMMSSPAPTAIILECTNLSPYIDAVRETSGLPVFDLIQGIRWLVDAQG